MALTPLDIQQQRFRVSFRGYDPKEVEAFLEQAANAFEDLQRETLRLADETKSCSPTSRSTNDARAPSSAPCCTPRKFWIRCRKMPAARRR